MTFGYRWLSAARLPIVVAMDAKVRRIVDRLVGQRRWETSEDAVNQCSIASNELLAMFVEAGVEAEALWFIDPRGDLSRAHDSARRDEAHMTVRVGGEIIDLTRRQWDCVADHPMVYSSIAAAGAHWWRYYPDGDDRSATPIPTIPEI